MLCRITNRSLRPPRRIAPPLLAAGSLLALTAFAAFGLLPIVSRHTELLHDGRAPSIAEAILWHSGQAERSREAFRTMPKADRDALVKFVESI